MTTRNRLMAGPDSSAGFTLIEMVVVIAVAVIIMAIAAPSLMNWRSGLNSNQAARSIVNLLMEARSRAISSNYQHELYIDVPNSQYQMCKGSQAYNSPDGVCPDTNWSVVSGYNWISLPTGVTMKSGTNCDVTSAVNVQFNANGTVKVPVTVCVQGGGGSKVHKIIVSTSGRITLN